MHKLNKIRAHIKMLEFQELKLTRYLAEANSQDLKRVQDIRRALTRVQHNIELWQTKLTAFETAVPRPVSRPAVNDGPDRPLIG